MTSLVVRRRAVVLVAAGILAVIGAAAAATLFGKLSAGGWDHPGSESGRATAFLEEEFGLGQPNLVLLASAPSGVDTPAAVTAGAGLSRRLAGEPGVIGVVSYWTAGQAPQLRSSAGDAALVLATIEGDPTTVQERLADLAPRYRGDQEGLAVRIGGYAMFEHELTEQSERDLTLAEAIVFPVTLVVLVVVFGSLLAAVLPLLVAMLVVLIGFAVMWLLADVTDLSVIAVNVVTLLGLGLAIDYSLLMVNRFREEVAGGRSTAAAIATMLRTAGRTVVYSSITVAVALSALAWFPLAALRSVAYAGIVTALLAGAVSLTVLPALFAVFGARLARGSWRRRAARPAAAGQTGFWHRLAMLVMRRPLVIATVLTGFLLALGSPFLGFELGWLDERTMPPSSEARQVASAVRTGFDAAEQDVLQVVVPEGGTGDATLGGYASDLSRLPHVARVDTATGSYVAGAQVAPAGEAHQRFASGPARYLAVVPEVGAPEQAQQLVRDVRAEPAPFETLVGGAAAVSVDGNQALLDRLPVSVVALAVGMVLLLFLLTGSLLLPLLASLLSALSLTATLGALVWVFQDGNLSGLFGGFTATGNLAGTIPVILFAIAFGLAMDYQVFMLSRIREQYERDGDGVAAVAVGLERVGRIVTAAAVLISLVFLGFLLSEIAMMKAFGLGLTLAVLLDATVVRGGLLPAVMRLGGRATWWAPAPLRRLHARFGLREHARTRSRPSP